MTTFAVLRQPAEFFERTGRRADVGQVHAAAFGDLPAARPDDIGILTPEREQCAENAHLFKRESLVEEYLDGQDGEGGLHEVSTQPCDELTPAATEDQPCVRCRREFSDPIGGKTRR